MYKYRVLTSFEIHPRLWLVANKALKAASRALGIQPPKLFFVTEDRLCGSIEWADPVVAFAERATSSIYVSVDQSLNQIAASTIHECRHVYDYAHNSESDEQEAENFERSIWGFQHAGKTRLVEILKALEEIGNRASSASAQTQPLRRYETRKDCLAGETIQEQRKKVVAEIRANYYKLAAARAETWTKPMFIPMFIP